MRAVKWTDVTLLALLADLAGICGNMAKQLAGLRAQYWQRLTS